MESSTAGVMNKLLCGVVDDGTAKSIKLTELVDTAGKTGTSSGNRDKLFVGYTPYYTAGIWCGYPDSNKPLEGYSPSHIGIWDEVMIRIHEQTVFTEFGEELLSFEENGTVRVEYCEDSGMIATPECRENGRSTYGIFKYGTVPIGKCDTHGLDEK